MKTAEIEEKIEEIKNQKQNLSGYATVKINELQRELRAALRSIDRRLQNIADRLEIQK